MDPSKITIRCLNSWSRRSRAGAWAVVVVAIRTLKSTEGGSNLVLDRLRPPHVDPAVPDRRPAFDLGEKGDDRDVARGRAAHDRGDSGPLEVGDEPVADFLRQRHSLAGVQVVDHRLQE